MSKRSRDCDSGVSQDMIPTLGLGEAPSLAESNSIGHQVRRSVWTPFAVIVEVHISFS